MNYLAQFVVILGLVVPACKSFMLDYTDCVNPSKIRRVDVNVCNPATERSSSSKKMYLVQPRTVTRLKGFRCRIKESRFRYYCGSFSHLKVAKVPTIQHDVLVSPDWCRLLSTQRHFQPPGSNQLFNVVIDQTTFVQIAAAGELKVGDDRVGCKGETMRTANGLVDDLMELVEYSVLVESEDFVAQGQMVESKSDHLELPCKLNSGGCETGDGTYIFDYVPTCTLEKIQVFTGTRTMGTYLVDEKKAILLNITGVTIAPQECGSVKLLSTNYPELFAVELADAANWPSLHPADLHLSVQERVREDYLAYRLERRMQSVQDMLKYSICQKTVSSSEDTPQVLPNGQYAYRRGDVLFVLSCVQKRGVIAELTTCHDKIPMDTNGEVWVDPITRMRTQHATQLPCSKKFPITLRVANNTWVAITPTLVPVAAPEQVSLEQDNDINHIDMAVSGPYTEAEQREWEQILEYPAYHQALLKSVTIGSCLETDSCTAGVSDSITRYDLTGLAKIYEETNILSRIDATIREYGDYMAALVLVIMAVRMMVHLSVMVMAYLQGGPAMALAIILTTCCGASKTLQKMKRRKQRTEELPLQTPKAETSAPLLTTPAPTVSFQAPSGRRFL